jgi:hypothetical protein
MSEMKIERRRIQSAQQSPLEQRIGIALNNTNVTAILLTALLGECDAAINVADQKAAVLKEAVFDPQCAHCP